MPHSINSIHELTQRTYIQPDPALGTLVQVVSGPVRPILLVQEALVAWSGVDLQQESFEATHFSPAAQPWWILLQPVGAGFVTWAIKMICLSETCVPKDSSVGAENQLTSGVIFLGTEQRAGHNSHSVFISIASLYSGSFLVCLFHYPTKRIGCIGKG